MGHHDAHGPVGGAERGRLALALALILGFMAVEVVVGSVANSLALLSDAAHMLTDAGAVGLSLVAIRLLLEAAPENTDVRAIGRAWRRSRASARSTTCTSRGRSRSCWLR